MELKAGYSHLSEEKWGNLVEWTYDTGENVLIGVGTPEFTETVISIDPEDLLSIADAVRGKMKRDLTDEVDRIRIYKEQHK